MSLNKILTKLKNSQKLMFHSELDGDFLNLISQDSAYFAEKEFVITKKPINEIQEEIQLGIRILGINFPLNEKLNKPLVLIPPKFEFWTYLLLSLKLALTGYNVTFLYHHWAFPLVELIKGNLTDDKYSEFRFINIEDYDIPQDTQILNFAESLKGLPNTIPSFSTAIVTKECDLDYTLAYIFANAFSFGGLKNANLKRIIIDEEIKDKFLEKFNNRLASFDEINESIIRSESLKEQIHSLISEGISDGGELIFGNSLYNGNKFGNFVFNGITRDMRIFQKNFYGPVLLLSYISLSNDGVLNGYLQQQPSKGIIVFSSETELNNQLLSALKNFVFVRRPNDNKLTNYKFAEYHPSLEALFYILGF